MAKKKTDAAPAVKKSEVKEKLDIIQEATQPNPTKVGVVKDCIKLNVRHAARPNALVVTTIPLKAEVKVDASFEHKEFYKVVTETGVEGFCMKKYIKVNK